MTEHDHIPTPDERLIDRATGDDDARAAPGEISGADRAAAALHSVLAPVRTMPDDLRARLVREGEAIVAASSGRAAGSAAGPAPKRSAAPWLAAAACLAVGGGAAIYFYAAAQQRASSLAESEARIAALQEQVAANESVLAAARSRVDQLVAELDTMGTDIADQRRAVADAARREVELAERLAAATSDLEIARLEIARLEAPIDPVELAANRRKLLEVPGTVRLAWSPFDLPDSPAEMRDVTGDVVWNDELQTGYLRFEGLPVNDPGVEQYQVWVIDERGLEQKVSGGVFNANAAGEIVVPIEPGIDVGRVALFAITVEDPGGTWVPDLRRRVVVAPRGEG